VVIGVAVGTAVGVAVGVAVRVGPGAVALEVGAVVAVDVGPAVAVDVGDTVAVAVAVAVTVAVGVAAEVEVAVAVAVAVGVPPPEVLMKRVSIAKSVHAPVHAVRLYTTEVICAAVLSRTPKKTASPLASLVVVNEPSELLPLKAWICAVNCAGPSA